MGKEALGEMSETLGKFAGMIVKELGGTGRQLVEGFKKGWREAMGETEPVAAGPAKRDEQA
ncbi:MAG: hypothetical protein ACE5H2_02460 [Terriglobia bacterium]